MVKSAPRRLLYFRALIWFSTVGFLLLVAAFLARFLALDAGMTEEARRTILRVRGMLVLLAVVGYGRYLLFPLDRWPRLWWGFLPIPILLLFWGPSPLATGRWGIYWQTGAVWTMFFALGEVGAAFLRRVYCLDLRRFPAREEARVLVPREAIKLAFLVTLAVGVGLYLLAVDYLFDRLLYAFLGMLPVLTAYLAPLALLGAAMEKAVAGRLIVLARAEEEALDRGDYTILAGYRLARETLLSSQRLTVSWFTPTALAGCCALLFLAAFFARW